jgi:Fur family ferric uptake transcriptional regulator
MRMTRQRKIILEVLSASDSPRSAEEIAHSVHAYDADMALSTIYRNLEKMLELGMVLQTRFQDGLARYEQTSAMHRHYLICTGCGQRQSIDVCPLHHLEEQLEASTGFKITDHQLNIYGLCPECQKKH